MSLYAEDTKVPVERSQAEIIRLIADKGGENWAIGGAKNHAVIVFEINQRRIHLDIPIPPENDFTHTQINHIRRSPAARKAKWEQERRRRWRTLLLMLKSKFEIIESGVRSWEQEFGLDILLPDGRTVGQFILPQVTSTYETGHMPPMLPAPPEEEQGV